MGFLEHESLRFFQFDSLVDDRLVHGVFTRQGGVSKGPWASLNLGNAVGDDPDRVAENHRRVFASLDRPRDSSFHLWQVHSSQVLVAERPHMGSPYPRADGVISDTPDVTLLLRFADCVPILLFDPSRPALGLVHAGWRGTLAGIASEAVRALQAEYGSSPAEVRAGIGPCIQRHHYPVGPEVVTAFRKSMGSSAGSHLERDNGKFLLDLPGANETLLRQAGVRQIERVKMCTACQPEQWYSHRGEGSRTGRFGVMAALRA